MRRRNEKSRSDRYGENRYGRGPYDRKEELSWRVKVQKARGIGQSTPNAEVQGVSSTAHEVVPYGQSSDMITSPNRDKKHGEIEEHVSGGSRGNKRLASAIVTPAHQRPPQDENVTIQGKDVALALTFSPQGPTSEVENDQVIGALEDMELLDSNEGAMMDCDEQDDDLLTEEVREMEAKARHSSGAGLSTALSRSDRKGPKGSARWTAPLGIKSKKRQVLRQGSPRLRTSKSSTRHKVGASGKERQDSKKPMENLSISDCLMGSKNSSKRYQ